MARSEWQLLLLRKKFPRASKATLPHRKKIYFLLPCTPLRGGAKKTVAHKNTHQEQQRTDPLFFSVHSLEVGRGFRPTRGLFAGENRPCFDRGHGLSDSRVLLHVNGAVDPLVPHRRLVGSIDYIDFNLNCSRERRGAPILGYGLQGVRSSLRVRVVDVVVVRCGVCL